MNSNSAISADKVLTPDPADRTPPKIVLYLNNKVADRQSNLEIDEKDENELRG